MAAPQQPAATRAHDAAGAQAFVRYWFDVVNHTFATQDTAAFDLLASRECSFCRSFVSRIQAYRVKGEIFVGGQFTPKTVVSPGIDGSGTAVVNADVVVAASTIRASDGTTVETDPGIKSMLVTVTLRPTTVAWTVEAVDAGR